MNENLLALAMFLGGGLLGYSIRAAIFIIRKNSLELSVSERLVQAREHAQEILDEAQEKAEILWAEIRDMERQKEVDYKQTEERLVKKETMLDIRALELDERKAFVEGRLEELREEKSELEVLTQKSRLVLETIAGFSTDEARDMLIRDTKRQYEADLMVRTHKLEAELRESLSERAKNILVTSIQRLAAATTNELATSTVPIENEDIKGKIIGKEGRNIRAFERFSGVELLVDETPGAIVISSFDPIRRAIAADTLMELIKDGRIQPAKIEEMLEKSKARIHEIMKERGSAAVFECGIYTLDPRVVAILGRLHYRTSYGQNVLQHSIEMAHLAEMLASEVGADPYIAKAGALVHDIGKALDHEFEGTHIDIGIKILRRFGTDERIITAMKSHHDDCPHETLEAVIVQTADMISGARPGARRDSAEMYLKRLTDLENLASRFEGVEKAYALQAGREIRIFVQPENVSDFEARDMAREIALSIEEELRYPGQIKVTIIREMRVVEYAR